MKFSVIKQNEIRMDKFDRGLQKQLLVCLSQIFPAPLSRDKLAEINCLFEDENHLAANLLYLEEHGLIQSGVKQGMAGFVINTGITRITAKGIDFIQQDGGLSAILNITTIKFHRDAVVVLEDLIAMSNLSDTDKQKAKSTLSELSTEALKTVVQAVTTTGLSMLIK